MTRRVGAGPRPSVTSARLSFPPLSDEIQLSMALPLDSDGFLRRECPTCEREFKWLHTENQDDTALVPEGGYYCPYCAIQAAADAWWTQAQLERMQNVVRREVVEPELEKFGRSLQSIGRGSGGFITAKLEMDHVPEADPLVETDDMRRVDFACHANEPVKVVDDWTGDVHCMICGTPATAARAPAG